MKEIGKIVEIDNNMAKILITRHTACGDCGACQVGRENLNMILFAENTVHGKSGDTVEIELQTENFIYASFIMYGIPLIGLIIGLLGGYYGAMAIGYDADAAQIPSAIAGLAFLALSYLGIRLRESKIKSMKKFKPVLVKIINE